MSMDPSSITRVITHYYCEHICVESEADVILCVWQVNATLHHHHLGLCFAVCTERISVASSRTLCIYCNFM